MHQAVDDGHDAGRVREHLAPFGKRAIGGHDSGLELITAVDDVEQQIGVAVGLRIIVGVVLVVARQRWGTHNDVAGLVVVGQAER